MNKLFLTFALTALTPVMTHASETRTLRVAGPDEAIVIDSENPGKGFTKYGESVLVDPAQTTKDEEPESWIQVSLDGNGQATEVATPTSSHAALAAAGTTSRRNSLKKDDTYPHGRHYADENPGATLGETYQVQQKTAETLAADTLAREKRKFAVDSFAEERGPWAAAQLGTTPKTVAQKLRRANRGESLVFNQKKQQWYTKHGEQVLHPDGQ